MQNLVLGLNLFGLALITLGGIGGAMATPSPTYNADGSITLGNPSDKEARIRIHKMQKRLPHFLVLIGVGAGMQAAALVLPLIFS